MKKSLLRTISKKHLALQRKSHSYLIRKRREAEKKYFKKKRALKAKFNANEKKIIFSASAVVLVAAIVVCIVLKPFEAVEIIPKKAEVTTSQRIILSDENPSVLNPNLAASVGTKSEMVVVSTDTSGKAKKIMDRVTLSDFSDPKAAKVKDATNLKSIENVNGDETWTAEGETLIWENKGKDIVYEGEGTKPLPVQPVIKYYLDGKEISADKIEGKSGHVKIEFTYTNKTWGKDFVPYSAASLVTLDKDLFSNITTNGTTVESGFNLMIYKICFPGLEDDISQSAGKQVKLGLDDKFEIEADVEDFELESINTVISNGTLSNLDDETISSLTDFGDIGGLLGGYSYQLAQGASELCGGLEIFRDSLQTLSEGSNVFTTNLEDYAQGISSLSSGLGQIIEKVSFLPEISAMLKDGQDMLNAIIDYLRGIIDHAACIETAITICIEVGDEDTAAELVILRESILSAEYSNTIIDMIIGYLESASGYIQEGYENIDLFYGALLEAGDGAATLAEVSQQLKDAQYLMNSGIQELSNRSSELVDGGALLRDGAYEFSYAVNNSGDYTQASDLSAALNRLKELKETDKKPHFYSGADSTTTGKTTYIFKVEY